MRPALTCPVRATRAVWPRVTAPALDHKAVPGRQHLGADPLRKHRGGGQLRKSDRLVNGPRVTGQGKDQPLVQTCSKPGCNAGPDALTPHPGQSTWAWPPPASLG